MLFNFGLQTVMYTFILIHMYMNVHTLVKCWREGALLVSELVSGSRGLDSNPLESLCFWCLFLCICILTHWQIQCWIVTCNGLASRTEKSGNTFRCFAKQIDWLRRLFLLPFRAMWIKITNYADIFLGGENANKCFDHIGKKSWIMQKSYSQFKILKRMHIIN